MGIVFRTGDILLVRTGYTAAWESFDQTRRAQEVCRESLHSVGLEQTEEMTRFIYETKFAAICSDCVAVEVGSS